MGVLESALGTSGKVNLFPINICYRKEPAGGVPGRDGKVFLYNVNLTVYRKYICYTISVLAIEGKESRMMYDTTGEENDNRRY